MDLLKAGKWKEALYQSQSEADLAYCNHLAAHGHQTQEAVDAAFRASGLYRDKWDGRHFSDWTTYGVFGDN